MKPSSQLKPRKLGSEAVLELCVSKWTIKVIHALARATKRHGALRRELAGVSQKMLTQTLRDLERAGLIQRTAFNLASPKVEYSLTQLGNSFVEPLNALCNWAEAHRDELEFVTSLKQTAKHAAAARAKSRGPEGGAPRRALI